MFFFVFCFFADDSVIVSFRMEVVKIMYSHAAFNIYAVLKLVYLNKANGKHKNKASSSHLQFCLPGSRLLNFCQHLRCSL